MTQKVGSVSQAKAFPHVVALHSTPEQKLRIPPPADGFDAKQPELPAPAVDNFRGPRKSRLSFKRRHTALGQLWDRHVERPFALGRDGFLAVDANGHIVGGSAVGATVRDMDLPKSPLDPVVKLFARSEEREVSFALPDGRKVLARTDKKGRQRLLNPEVEQSRVAAGLDPKLGGLVEIGLATPNGADGVAKMLVLPKDYDGPIFICDIDQTVRDTHLRKVAKGEVQEPIEGVAEVLRQVAAKGVPIIYLSAGADRIQHVNRPFLAQLPNGILLDKETFGLRDLTPKNSFQAMHQGRYKGFMLAEVKRAFPNAQLFGMGDDKYGDAMAYTRQGLQAYVRDVKKTEQNVPADFTGVKVKTYTPAFAAQVGADLQIALDRSKSFGGNPVRVDQTAELSRKLDLLTGTRAKPGNKIDIFIDGDEGLPEILREIDGAKRSIYYETFQFIPGQDIPKEIAGRLLAAQKRGVQVRLVVDAVGSYDVLFLKNRMLRKLRDDGVEVLFYNPIDGIKDITDLKRDHRKTFVFDEERAIVTGMNTGDSFMGPPDNPKRYHDVLSRVQGPLVRELVDHFLDSRKAAGGGALPAGELRRPALPVFADGVKARVVAHVPKNDANIRAAYLTMINSARHRINIENDFPMTADLRDALIAAAQRGVEVRYIVGSHSGILGVATRKNFQQMLDAGIRIFVYPTKVHTKSFSVDGKYCSYGSSNVDNVALSRNREVIVLVEDEAFTQAYDRRLFDRDVVSDGQGNRTIELPRRVRMSFWMKLRDRLVDRLWPDTIE